jgi:WD40 repeat protein
METREKSPARHIVPAPTGALAVRSAAIVARGLRDLARDSNWLVKKVFTGRASRLAISSRGQLCALSPLVRHGTERIALYDIELGVPTLTLAIPGESPVLASDLPAAFAWSPTARFLTAAWGGWLPELHVFDLDGKTYLGAFGDFSHFPNSLAWSSTGKYFAAASSGGPEARLRLWEAAPQSAAMLFASEPCSELEPLDAAAVAESAQPSATEADDDQGVFSGYGCTLFSPDEGTLATVVEMHGEWADDSIQLLEVPTLRKQILFQIQGHVTDLDWASDSRQVIYCSAGQAGRVMSQSKEIEPLPFGAELCACHPHLPLCLFFSSWLKNSAKGRLFLADLNRLTVFDEYPAEGVVDLRWSLDGSKAYAITAEGMAYIYEPPLL